MRFKKFDEVVPEKKFVFFKEPGEADVRETSETRKETGTFTFYFKVYKVSKLQDGMSGAKKTVICSYIFRTEYKGDAVFIFGFTKSEYKSFNNNSFCPILEGIHEGTLWV